MSTSSSLTPSSLSPDLGFNWVFLVELIVCIFVTLFVLFYFNRVFAAFVSFGIRSWTWHRYRVYIDIQSLQISILGGRLFFKGVKYHGNNETIFIHEGFITWSYWLRQVRELDLGTPSDHKRKRVSTDSSGSTSSESEANVRSEESDRIVEVERGGIRKTSQALPCRLNVRVRGLEWFIYNRSPAYDDILAAMTGDGHEGEEEIVQCSEQDPGKVEGIKRRLRTKFERAGAKGGEEQAVKDATQNGSNSDSVDWEKPSTSSSDKSDGLYSQPTLVTQNTSTTSPDAARNIAQENDENMLLQFLPIHVELSKAAIVMGNENTKSVLIIKVDKGNGSIGASGCTSPDLYRQIIDFDLEHPVIQMKPNDDFREEQAAAGVRLKTGKQQAHLNASHVHQRSFLHRYRRKAMHQLQNLVPAWRTSVESVSSGTAEHAIPGSGDSSQWQGLSRYLDDFERDDKARWSNIEYAVVTTVVDCPKASISYYWDIPGKVPQHLKSSSEVRQIDINGEEPPAFGLDVYVQGAAINYGPWADRQRADIMKVFFPSLCKDAKPATKLKPGTARIPTKFKVYVQLEAEAVLRIPIREDSKNWKWKKTADTMGQRVNKQTKRSSKNGRKHKNDKGASGPEIRPFGWFDVKVAANSTVKYSMDMVAGPLGFTNHLHVDIPNTEITSSVNHGLLWRSIDQRLFCDLSNPLQWNGPHQWKFDIVSNGLELFILREHIFLIQDLVEDFTTGPPPDYLTFSAFKYMLNLRFGDFRLYLNTNDSNIINNPSDFDDNTYIIIFGTQLMADVCIPNECFRPYRNDITFDIKANTGGLNLHVPPWNTQATFLLNTELARLKDLGISGKYQLCSTTSPSNTDSLLLDIHARDFELEAYGFVIRYFLVLKENYFGDHIHFKTLDEYQLLLHTDEGLNEDPTTSQPLKKSNDLDVILTISAEDNCLIIPSNLYSAKNNMRVEISALCLDLRFTNYYMDMQLNLCPLSFSTGQDQTGTATPLGGPSSSQLFVDGIDIFGHRVFGLPHSEPTYICNWDFAVGAVTGECSTECLARLIGGIRALAFSFDDDENALPGVSSVPVHDVTFLRASVQPIRVWLHIDESALLFSTGALEVTFDDWAGVLYSKKLQLEIPELIIACVDGESASRHRTRTQQSVETHAYIQTTILVNMVDRSVGFDEKRRLQQLHIRREDARTGRAQFLLHPEVLEDMPYDAPFNLDSPAMPFPPMPIPIEHDGQLFEGDKSSMSGTSGRSSESWHRYSKRLRRCSSFLSTVSSSQTSQRFSTRKKSAFPASSAQARQTSGSHSRSRPTLAVQTRPRMRDFSASTGRGSSFHSAIASHGDRGGLPPSSVVFSSSYLAPYFPLEGIEPDLKDVPDLSLDSDDNPEINKVQDPGVASIDDSKFDTHASHASFIIQMNDGIRAHCNPEAVNAIAGLITSMQAAHPEDILDVLQIESIEDIFDQNRKKIRTGSNTDIKIVVPITHVRFTNAAGRSVDSTSHELDQYDVVLKGVNVTMRNSLVAKVLIDGVTERQSRTSLHIKMRSARASATEKLKGMENAQAAVNANLEDMMFWMVSDDKLSIHLQLRDVEVATKNHEIRYLASLISRTATQAEEFANKFEALTITQHNRIQLFTFLVCAAGADTADPLFLTRPSYVLRSATDHLRMKDSWKVVTRLRSMFRSLDSATRHDIIMRCLSNNEACPVDVKEQVLAGLDEWRSWDLENLSNCIIAQKVFGPLHKETTPLDPEEIPVKLALAVGSIRLVLDPGPKQNEISFTTLGFMIDIKPPTSVVDDNISETSVSVSDPLHTTSIQIHCKDASVTLNWELLVLAENSLKLYNELHASSTPPAAPIFPFEKKASSGMQRQVHVVFVTEKWSIAVETINLRLISISKGLTASLLVTEDLSSRSRLVSIMTSADAATTKLRNRATELSLSQVRYPSVYLSFENDCIEGVEHKTWKISANSRELTFVLRQHSLAILEVVDLVLGDEVAQVLGLVRLLPKKSKKTTLPQPAKEKPPTITKINVALFLDMYHLTVPVVQSLTYNIAGVIARASIAAHLGSDIVFDFDVKENTHDIQTKLHGKKNSLSLLQMPSTNGRITSHEGPAEHSISVLASIEQIQFDAAAIHNLLGTLNKPEIASVFGEVRRTFKDVQSHAEELFQPEVRPMTKSEPAIAVSRPFVYEAHVAFAGLEVFAETSGGNDDHARLSFNIGTVQIEAANRLERSGPLLAFPEVRIGLKETVLDLTRVSQHGVEPCGNFQFAACLTAGSKRSSQGNQVRSYHLQSNELHVNLFADTASTVVDVINHLQDRIRDLDLSREKQYLQKLRKPNPEIVLNDDDESIADDVSTALFASMYSLELLDIQVSWIVSNNSVTSRREFEDLVLSLKRINLSTRKENSARLTIEDLQLQMVPVSASKRQRSQNSALLPEVMFNIAYVSGQDARRLAFQAAGKSLDLQLTSQFIVPLVHIKKSIETAVDKVRAATISWNSPSDTATSSETHAHKPKRKPFIGKKRMGSLLVDADFAGAVVHLSNKRAGNGKSGHGTKHSLDGRYGQFAQEDATSSTVLRAPGLAWKVEFKDNGVDDSTLDGEIKVDASTNILYPTVVALILEISETVKEVVNSAEEEREKPSVEKVSAPKFINVNENDNILAADPSAVLGRTQLNLGLRICKQEFSLSCQPIARVAATATFEDIYITINTVKSLEHGHFFTISSTGRKLQASVQHVYSRESTGSFEVDSVFLSLMNSKHVSGTAGLSAILSISPMKVLVNAKQLQDFLLFREIWMPPELRPQEKVPVSNTNTTQSNTFLVQRYQQVAATGAFPWNATLHVAELDVQLDLGQAIGKSAFMISKFWVSSKKNSDWDQNLCFGFEKMGVDSAGRMSGFLHVQDFRVRSSIHWPQREMALNQTPLVQASVAFNKFRAKASFDYQPFLVADITSFEFLMYNVRNSASRGDRLVAVLDGDAVQIFCTTTTASQALALYQAFQRLVQEKRANYETSLREIEKFMKRKSVAPSNTTLNVANGLYAEQDKDISKSPISLYTDVVVTLKAVSMGVFPSTFYDQQVFKLEALNAQARFAVTIDQDSKIHSSLALTLGQLRIGLASIRRASMSKISADVSVEEVVEAATGSRGGTILKVPKVKAIMECWQYADSNKIEYIFKSAFEGKVEVGWNYSRISYIRGMYGSHTRSLAQRLGKPLPESAVKITGVPKPGTPNPDEDPALSEGSTGKQQKITAEVNVPVSKYEYTALEPPIIETPQLKDMGEATPPLEWIGLHRDRLPNLTHQIVIVSLLEIASEVEEAYRKILGNS